MNRNLKRYLRRTYKNKIMAVALLTLGIVSVYVTMDATFLAFTGLMALALFFARENYICM